MAYNFDFSGSGLLDSDTVTVVEVRWKWFYDAVPGGVSKNTSIIGYTDAPALTGGGSNVSDNANLPSANAFSGWFDITGTFTSNQLRQTNWGVGLIVTWASGLPASVAKVDTCEVKVTYTQSSPVISPRFTRPSRRSTKYPFPVPVFSWMQSQPGIMVLPQPC